MKLEYVGTISADFMEVVCMMINKDLIIGCNMSCYNYYVIRLCSQRKIELVKEVSDMKNSKSKQRFHANLVGTIFKELGWDKGFKCPYYLDWLEKTWGKTNDVPTARQIVHRP